MMRTVFFGIMISLQLFAAGGNFQRGSFSNPAGSREYLLYTPGNFDQHNQAPLVVALHGCIQTANDFALQTGFNDLAEKYGFMVLYPEQAYAYNTLKCWNWFKPENQQRAGGENSIIVGLTEKIVREMNIDPKRIFIVGLSAGAAMASNIFACHSDLFSGLGVHSGLEFHAARNDSEAQQVMKNGATQSLPESAKLAADCVGPAGRPGKIVVIHGSEDNVVNPVNADRTISQFAKINDWLDDNSDNGSQTDNIISTVNGAVPGGYAYVINYYGVHDKVQMTQIKVQGMKHAWSGAHRSGPYADPKGPDAAELMWNLFSR